jgi:hypothetical protein
VLIAMAAIVLGLALFSSAAQACSYPSAEQVFSKWGDHNYYELAPEGGFEEGGSGWTLAGGAQLVEGNESYFLNGSEDKTALSLPYGSSATSPRVCVDETTPAFRLMDANGGARSSKLTVTVTYELAETDKERDSEIRGEEEWGPSRLLRLKAGKNTERVARITLEPNDPKGEWLVDDLYVDPFGRH